MNKDNSIKLHRYDHLIFNQYEDLLYPLSASVVLSINYGIRGAIIGFVLGGIDAASIQYKIYNKPYLTSAVFGVSIFPPSQKIRELIPRTNSDLIPQSPTRIIRTVSNINSLKHSFEQKLQNSYPELRLPYPLEILGVGLGLTVPTGLLNKYEETIIHLLTSGAYGYSYGNIYDNPKFGSILGAALGLIDETINYLDLIQGSLLSSGLKYIVIANTIIPKTISPYIIYPILDRLFQTSDDKKEIITKALVHFVGAAFIYFFPNTYKKNYKDKPSIFALNHKLYDLYNNTIPSERLDDLFNKQIVALVATKLIALKITISIDNYKNIVYTNMATVFEEAVWKKFIEPFQAVATLSIPYIIGYASDGLINEYFQTIIKLYLEKYFDLELTNNNITLHLLSNTENTTDSVMLIQNSHNDIHFITDVGGSLSNDGLATAIDTCYTINYLYHHNIDPILYNSIYYQITSSITTNLASSENTHTPDIKKSQTNVAIYLNHIVTNAPSIAETDKNLFIRSKLQHERELLNGYESLQSGWNIWIKIWANIQSVSDLIINAFIIGNEIKYNKALNKQAWTILNFMTKVSRMLRWEATNSGKLLALQTSASRIETLKNKIAIAKDLNKLPEKKLIYKYKQSNQPFICFKNLTIGVRSDSRFSVDDLCIKDKITAITGDSGCGKSTFSKITKQLQHTEAWGKGTIIYYTKSGKAANIWMTSQNENFTPKSTLLELITSKTQFEAKKHEQFIKALLKEIRIDNVENNEEAINLESRLNEETSWETVLSGGQKQKIIFLGIVFKAKKLEKPDFIIFDEIFKGMDSNSIKTTQTMIKKYLPNSHILIIDHHADIEKGDFYENQLHFTNNTIIINNNDNQICSPTESLSFNWGTDQTLDYC